MKNLFAWKLDPSEADFKQLWNNAIFIFDTNFLLDLYRVSHSTVQDYLKILNHIQDRVWLPYQVAEEFLALREKVIEKEVDSFKTALVEFKKWKKDVQSFKVLKDSFNRVGKIVSSEINSMFDHQSNFFAAIDEIEKCFSEKIQEISKSHSLDETKKDYILENILSIFDGKVGKSYDTHTQLQLYQEGAKRYEQGKPPGFEDRTKEQEKNKYGDFILWKQILDFAKAESHSIIFITGDTKKDWWIKKNGKIVCPHQELRREFQESVAQLFWIYQPSDFVHEADSRLPLEINPITVEETDNLIDSQPIDDDGFEETDEFKISQLVDTDRILKAALSHERLIPSWLQTDKDLRAELSQLYFKDLSRIDKAFRAALSHERLIDKVLKVALSQERTIAGLSLTEAIEKLAQQQKRFKTDE